MLAFFLLLYILIVSCDASCKDLPIGRPLTARKGGTPAPLGQAHSKKVTFSVYRQSILPLYQEEGVIFLPGVYLNEDDYNFDIALRRFKKQVEKAGVLSEMKKRQHYEKPSVMRKKKKAAARKRLMKKIRKMNLA